MSGLCDLHTHTTASDGQYTPSQLAALAKERGLSVLAVTDHDTTAGVDEARRAGPRLLPVSFKQLRAPETGMNFGSRLLLLKK